MSEEQPARQAKRAQRKQRERSGTTLVDNTTAPSSLSARSDGRQSAQHGSLRAGMAVFGGRTAGALSRRLHLGGGTGIAGIVAQRLYPDIVHHLATQLAHGSILVTGTNGKTTTSGFIAAILSDAGLRVWRNREGSNLMRGIAGALVIRAEFNGNLRRRGQAISIFEVDEAVVPQMMREVPLRVAVFNNLFRDQLDRYGEVDSVSARWQQAISTVPETTTLVLNADDPAIAQLGAAFHGPVVYYGIDSTAIDLGTQHISSERHQVIDTRTCPTCGSEFDYTTRFYSHLGHYICPTCGNRRPEPQVRAVKISTNAFDQLHMTVIAPSYAGEIVIPLPGFYNVYNALAAIATAQALHIDWAPVVSGIQQFKPAFGRGERVQVAGRTLRILLAKNPTGWNEVLRTVYNGDEPRHALMMLNDNIADGRDVSWIWDVDFEYIIDHTGTLTVTGTRALDLALRLKYAGIAPESINIIPSIPLRAARTVPGKGAVGPPAGANGASPTRGEAAHTKRLSSLARALDAAIASTPAGETLFVIPTYTGLLDIHRELERRGLTPHYWEEKGP
jgi:UDP-N-acetylmuramyl tripeptide synthase